MSRAILAAALLVTASATTSSCIPAGSGLRAALFPSWALREAFDDRAPTLPEGGEILHVSAPGGVVEAFYLPAAEPAHGAPLVIVLHGNAETIDDRLGTAARFHELGAGVLLPEYRSYGRSGGTPSEAHIADDLALFYDQVTARPEVDASRVAVYGCSLGGGLAGSLASRRPVAALVLTSTFSSFRALAAEFGVPDLVVHDDLDTRTTLEHTGVPALIVHGRQDPLIGIDHAVALRDAHGDNALVLHDGGHSCRTPWPRVADFLTQRGVLDSPAASAP